MFRGAFDSEVTEELAPIFCCVIVEVCHDCMHVIVLEMTLPSFGQIDRDFGKGKLLRRIVEGWPDFVVLETHRQNVNRIPLDEKPPLPTNPATLPIATWVGFSVIVEVAGLGCPKKPNSLRLCHDALLVSG